MPRLKFLESWILADQTFTNSSGRYCRGDQKAA
jgi:hypothetical protein